MTVRHPLKVSTLATAFRWWWYIYAKNWEWLKLVQKQQQPPCLPLLEGRNIRTTFHVERAQRSAAKSTAKHVKFLWQIACFTMHNTLAFLIIGQRADVIEKAWLIIARNVVPRFSQVCLLEHHVLHSKSHGHLAKERKTWWITKRKFGLL